MGVPSPGTTWQWQLAETIDTSFDVAVYDIDLFDVPQTTINSLHAAGRKVICYFSAGTYEPWRPDAADFPASVKGSPMEDWPDEKWLDIGQLDVLRPIMAGRLQLAADKGCDGVEPDNVDGYANANGVGLTASEQLAYNKMIAELAHERNLSVGLKNDLDQVSQLVDFFDFAVNEQCHEYNECGVLMPFVQQGKAVFQCEYLEEGATAALVCPEALSRQFSAILKEYDLYALPFVSCSAGQATASSSSSRTPSRTPTRSRTPSRTPTRSLTPSRTPSRSRLA